MRVLEGGYSRAFMGTRNVLQRQDAPETFRFTGNIFLTRTDFLMSSRQLWGDKSIPLIEAETVGFNIDSQLDFEIAEFLYSKKLT
jgi:CMP-N-acetylneuraminic acid synthetase